MKGHSDLVRQDYEQLSSYWIFYPDDEKNTTTTGELMYWNDFSDIDRFVALVKREGFGGAFTWCASGDAEDWRVHKRIRQGLMNTTTAEAAGAKQQGRAADYGSAIEEQGPTSATLLLV